MKQKKRNQKTLDSLAKAIEKMYGPRCSRNMGGCVVCTAWTVFDAMERLLEE